jgi:hypothetical protein
MHSLLTSELGTILWPASGCSGFKPVVRSPLLMKWEVEYTPESMWMGFVSDECHVVSMLINKGVYSNTDLMPLIQ